MTAEIYSIDRNIALKHVDDAFLAVEDAIKQLEVLGYDDLSKYQDRRVYEDVETRERTPMVTGAGHRLQQLARRIYNLQTRIQNYRALQPSVNHVF